MSIDEIKDQIAKLSPTEQDDIRQYIDALQSNKTGIDPFSDEVWEEIKRRDAALQSGEMDSYPARDILKNMLDSLS